MTLNPFDQYTGDENRLTHALAVTLERSSKFQKRFLDLCHVKENFRNIRVDIQDVGETSIPDLLLIDVEKDSALLFEVKVGASLSASQLQRHETHTKDGLRIYGRYVITARDADRNKIQKKWKYISWVEIHEAADQLRDACGWAKDLADYIYIVASEMSDESKNGGIKMTGFTGIPFKAQGKEKGNPETIYDPRRAKVILRSLVDEMEQDKSLLSDLEIQQVKRRDKIKTSGNVWDYLSPVGSEGKHIKSHHFTVTLTPEYASAMLTLPDKSKELKKIQKLLKNNDIYWFESMVKGFLGEFKALGLDKEGIHPCIGLVQRRYSNQSQIYSLDGELTFDLRTLEGRKRNGKVPAIKRQPEWVGFCCNLLKNKDSNLQFQIGVRFFYKRAKGLEDKKATDLFKNALRATAPVLDIIHA